VIIQDLTTHLQVAKYILVPKGTQYKTEADEIVIPTPIEDIGILSSSYIGYLDALELTSNISIIENHNFIYHPGVLGQYKNGKTLEIGSNGQINLEKLVLNAPEIIFTSVFNGGLSDDLLKAQDAGIAILQCSEWQENHPLARAEWIKLFGALTDQETLADSLFSEIETNYLAISNKCKKVSHQPKVLFSSMYQDIWYIPGGQSYIAKVLKDVNATYAWSNNDNTGSLQLSFETVAANAIQSDVWINPEVNSIEELLSRDPRYQAFVTNISQGIYQQNAKTTPEGGNDYWESGVVHPDWVLQDYAKIIHPQLFENINFTYFKQLK
jgi:iron complex transport system substrate-binding protein